MRLILPTADLVREYKEHEDLFVFYEGGIRGVIGDIVLNCDPELVRRYPEFRGKKPVIAEKTVEQIVRAYVNSPEALCLYYLEKTDNTVYVELIAEMLDQAVAEMLATLFCLQRIYIYHKHWQWVGDDMLTLIRYC